MLAYSFYETDGRVMRYAETLAHAGYEVEAIGLRRESQAEQENINNVNVLRIQRRIKNESGKFSYLMKIIVFFIRSCWMITRRHWQRPYALIHVHSVPDFEVFATLFAKLTGAKIILDIHDIVPEFYAAKFNVKQDSLVFKVLKWVEKISAAFADHVIIANDLWRGKITSRSVASAKCSSFINYPDLAIFHPGLRTRTDDGKFVMVYPGTLNWHQGLDIAVSAFDLIKDQVPDLEFHIYGEGGAKDEIEELIVGKNLQGRIFLHDPIPLKEVAVVMANADLGVVPKRNDAFGGEAFSTKILEFMSLGVPLVVADTKVDTYYFNDKLLRFFQAGNELSLAKVILQAFQNRKQNQQMAARALAFAEKNSWREKEGDYLKLVDTLLISGVERR